MTAAMDVTNCPTAETLAAFVDGRLSESERAAVIRHMADCAECRDLVLLTTELAAVEGEPTNVVRPRFGKKWIAPLVAVAAAIAVVVAVPQVRERVFGRSAKPEVIAALEAQVERQTESRLSLDLQHKEPKPRNRGGEKDAAEYRALNALNKAALRVESDPTPENRHLLGIALLLNNERDEAIEQLELAAKGAPSAAVLNDLAAAYLERGADDDYERALDRSNEALRIERSSAGMWNRALALERLERYDEAITAWEQYVAAETSPAWAAEAGKRLAELRERRRTLR
jgi:hypothetical protein